MRLHLTRSMLGNTATLVALVVLALWLLSLQGKLQADAADALALAITHAHVRASANRLGVATRTAWRKSR